MTTNTEEQKQQQQQQQEQPQRRVFIAGATGYLGRHLVHEYLANRKEANWQVSVLVRKLQGTDVFPATVHQVVAQATDRDSLWQEASDSMNKADLVVSALGITRQRDGLTYQDVDYQANKNLLDLAIQNGVSHFAYIHVLNGDKMSDAGVTAIQAKQHFCQALQAASAAHEIRSTIVCPSGFFSDMNDFLEMARHGRAYLFGNGQQKLNPIHGADLATATADAIEKRQTQVNVGGPDTFTHQQLAELAFECLNNNDNDDDDKNQQQIKQTQQPKITFLPDGIRRFLIWIVPWVTPLHVGGPIQFFLTAFGMDMVGDTACGKHHLKDFFLESVRQQNNVAAAATNKANAKEGQQDEQQ